MPLVSGTNGQTTPFSSDEVERLLQTPAPVETVGAFRFSLWKIDRPLTSRPPRFSPAFFAVVLLGTFGLIGLGAWVAGRIREGDFMVGNVFGVGLFVAMYGGMIVAVIASRRRRSHAGTPEGPPGGIPAHAVAAHAAVRGRGRSVGWLWFEGDRLCFRGVGFDFRLRREDFANKRSFPKAFQTGGTPSLKGPRGLTEYMLGLSPGAIVGGEFVSDPSRWKGLEAEFLVWESGSFSSEPSLFPPIRPVETIPGSLRWTQFVVPAALMGSILGFAGLVLPFAHPPSNGPWGFALAGAAFGLFWPYVVWSSDRTGKRFVAEADRVVARTPSVSS